MVVHHKRALYVDGSTRLRGIFGHRQRQPEAKARPLSDLTVDPDRTLHPLDQPLSDGKPKPCTLKLAVRLAFHLVELAKDEIEVLRRNADAGIFDRHMQLLTTRRVLQPHHPHQNVPLVGKLHRIADQIGQDLPQPSRIADISGGQEHVEIDHQIDALSRARGCSSMVTSWMARSRSKGSG